MITGSRRLAREANREQPILYVRQGNRRNTDLFAFKSRAIPNL